jgi:hypothetical protein
MNALAILIMYTFTQAVGGCASEMKGRGTDQFLRLHGKGNQNCAHDCSGGEQHGEEQKPASEKHRRKEPIFLLTKTIAQNTDEPQECDSRKWHQIQRECHLARIAVEPSAGFVWIGRDRSSQEPKDGNHQDGKEHTRDSGGAWCLQVRPGKSVVRHPSGFPPDANPIRSQSSQVSKLRGSIAFGPERTIEQDATFAFRVIVDIAIRALSKAINDPTTAVLAIDQLQRLLRVVGGRDLHDEQIMDGAGHLRVIFPTPNWEDFVQLAFREIRLYGAENFQIARRLRAMVNNLVEILPESRQPALRVELELLDRAIETLFILPEDLAVARIPDAQGLGGSSGGLPAEISPRPEQ